MFVFKRILQNYLLVNNPIIQQRSITALYMTGDKAKEQFAPMQPYMEFGMILQNKDQLEYSCAKRKMDIDIEAIIGDYKNYKEFKNKMHDLDKQRETNAEQLKNLLKKTDTPVDTLNQLRSRGKALRQELKSLRESFYPIEDAFAHKFLNLPNLLHEQCPTDDKEKLLYRKNSIESIMHESVKSHLSYIDVIRFLANDRYYLMGEAAKYDYHCTQAMTRCFVNNGDFIQTANPDFTRCLLLEANATPSNQYHRVIEDTLGHGINYPYLTGGASFESYLGAVAKLCITPNVLPMRYVSCGRCYERQSPSSSSSSSSSQLNNSEIASDKGSLYTATQSNAVQTFCAVDNAEAADEQMYSILNLAVDFYKTLDINFRVRLVDASELTNAESLRANIEIYSPVEKRYITVGRVSQYAKYISERILFGMRLNKEYHFLHVVGGPVLFTTRLIAVLIENNLPLDSASLLNAFMPDNVKVSAFDEFHDIFK